MIIDASVILSALFPDEAQTQAQAIIRDHAAGQISLTAPTLLQYELTNAVWQGVRRQRINIEQAHEIMATVDRLDIPLQFVDWQTMMNWAGKYDRSAYDAAYLGLAQRQNDQLITGNLRLYNAVRHSEKWVIWVGDYESLTTP